MILLSTQVGDYINTMRHRRLEKLSIEKAFL